MSRPRLAATAFLVAVGAAGGTASAFASGQIPRPPHSGAVTWPRAAAELDPAADPHALKIVVARDGPVAVTGAQLSAAGWDLATIESARLALTCAGTAQAIELEETGSPWLEPEDRIVFQGRAVPGPYTRENVYWLTTSGEGARVRGRAARAVPGLQEASVFTDTLHLEKDTIYYASMRAHEGDDRWLWGDPILAGTAREERFTLRHPARAGPPARLRVRLHGYGSDSAVDPDHHVRFLVNGQSAGEARFDGIGAFVSAFGVPLSALAADGNILTIENAGDTGALVDMVALNWFELDYAAEYAATADRLDFRPPAAGTFAYALTGFSGDDVAVLDVTDPASPVRLTSVGVLPGADGTFTVSFGDTAGADARYVAYTASAIASPPRIVPNSASDWRSTDHGADYIAITHPAFADALVPLMEYRRAQGLRTAVVLIDDVYDEFAHGVFDPRAIRDFLRHAHVTWEPPAPTYVLLVGESNLDYRRAYAAGPLNFVPTMQVDIDLSGDLGAVTSDLWFANLSGPDDDVVPEVLIGRFSVSTPAQARTIVSKTLAYEAIAATAPWRDTAVLVVDDGSTGSFEEFSEELAATMGPSTNVSRFYAASYPRDRDLTGDLRAAIQAGTRVVNFIGHGNVDLWSPWPGGGRIFQNSDIAGLTNGDRLPILTSATCMNGWIDNPLNPVSMGELWLTQPCGGGVAAWAPSGYSFLSGQRPMLHAFYQGLYGEEQATLGELAARGVAAAVAEEPTWDDIARMFVLLGDPALSVGGDKAPATTTATPTATSTPTSPDTPTPSVDSRRAWLPFAMANRAPRGIQTHVLGNR